MLTMFRAMQGRGLAAGAALWMLTALSATAQTAANDVIVNFVTTTATPLNPGFSGFNNNLKNAVEYYDTHFQQILTTLSPGWLRFPAGTDSEAFDWASGEIVSAWIDALATNPYQHDINAAAQPVVAGKGGASFSDFANMATNVGGAKIIVSVNAFTDTPQSAQAFAQYALTNHIPVAAWELANEPYTWIKSGAFFTDATDYANKMKPYRDAIKAADPNAVVALYFSEAGHPNTTWDDALASYSSKYWDAVTYHEYVYPGNLTTFDDLMAAANGNLFSNTTSHVTDYLMPRNNSGVTYLISEVSPSDGHGGVLLGTLYGGIYSAEFALRMSTLPQVKYVASFQMLSNAGIDETNNNLNVVDAAYNSGTTINTSGLNFGFFLSAQAAGEAVANGALHNAIGVFATTTTGGPTAPTNGGGSIPAVYAQAYDGGNGKRYVVLTNKGAFTAVAHITQDGVVPTNPMQMTFVTGSDPSLFNSNPAPNNVQIQTLTVTTPGTVTIPSYSVVRLEWLATANYQGLWWAAPGGSEAGWGINFAHQGDTIFASWFTYDLTGKGTWLVMTANKTAPNTYSGALVQGTGPAFDAVPFPPVGSPGGATVSGLGGTGTLTFSDANNGTFAYTLGGITQAKAITRELIGPQPICLFGALADLSLATNYTDLWWAAPAGSEAGWGINLTHEGDTIFATWFTFDVDHTPLWLVVTASKTAPGVYAGTPVYRLTGPPFSSMPFPPLGSPGGATGVGVGSASFTFSDGNTATFNYTVNGVTQTKTITREVFTAPGTVCQ